MPKVSAKSSAKSSKADKSDKPKREPTAYNLFCKDNMSKWNTENPGRQKEAMKAMAALWKDSPLNPNRGKEVKRKTKVPKASTDEPSSSSQPTDKENFPSSDF